MNRVSYFRKQGLPHDVYANNIPDGTDVAGGEVVDDDVPVEVTEEPTIE